MSKMKTHKGASKRYKKTSGGKYLHKKAFSEHKLTHKSGKRRRNLRKKKAVDSTEQRYMKKLLPYG